MQVFANEKKFFKWSFIWPEENVVGFTYNTRIVWSIKHKSFPYKTSYIVHLVHPLEAQKFLMCNLKSETPRNSGNTEMDRDDDAKQKYIQ